ncbi:Ribonucleoside-triphosphate reductase, adenosylcobalamin-dependent [Phytophthora megakarya]|uniref:Ribonucleoside-triphosphate reductase, adenosylcobalamin-dependent n=1 Tax=Phytophthora megakarya TaxID=4795 RepID=A0A225VWJ8_9STRA|nr:Ribonucleoside-triphosphate reductase, adenosylcobalamin-dependent [Phytophthora megakarya]
MAPTTSHPMSSSVTIVDSKAGIKSNVMFETRDSNTVMGTCTTPDYKPFELDATFVAGFESQTPPFGFNGLGELVYIRTYSRVKTDGTKERWFETIERVINGTFNMQKKWLQQLGQPWNEEEMNRIAQEMYTRVFQMKFTPPGRGLWAMGSPITEDRGLFAALNNCAFVSTADILELDTPAEPFCFLMEAAMLGVGVGFDTKDSREGWVESVKLLLEAHFLHQPALNFNYSLVLVKLLLEAHFLHQPALNFNYSLVRPAGAPIKGFGSISSGASSLTALHEAIESILKSLAGKLLTARGIVDIMNQMGVCVVSGNVRRTAEIAFGDYNDEEYVDLKNYEKNPDRAAYGWTSNNSIFADIGMDYKPIAERIVRNGEPGFAWLENMRNFGRMNGVKDDRDRNASGGNPCLEQTLESYEMCCLVETFPYNHDSLEDFLETLKYAYMYAKTVTLGQTQWSRTNEVMQRNRRIGCSIMSGITQFISNRGLNEFQRWCEAGYDRIQEVDKKLSTRFAIPRSIKTTSIKPSGTVSLLAGATPGMHYPESRFYIRRMRLDKHSDVLPALQRAGYEIEPANEAPDSTLVVSIPVDVGKGVRTLSDVSAWEQFALAAFLQRHWADNQVSCTVTFDPKTEGSQLAHMLDYFQYQLKGISLLPKLELGAYKQMPYEEINARIYHKMNKSIDPLQFNVIQSSETVMNVPDKYCEACVAQH